MLYECACGFSSSTATTFYRHLASQKDTGEHQLVQARLSSDTSSIGSPAHHRHHAPSLPPSPKHAPPPVPIAAGSPSKKMTGVRRRMKTCSPATTPEKKADAIEEEIVEQIDCRQQQQAGNEDVSNNAQDGLLSRVGAAIGTLVLSSINPVRLFGLASGASSFLQSPPSPAGEPNLNSHPIPVSTSTESLANAETRQTELHVLSKSAEARNMILATEAALLWVDPYRSLRILALCLYLTVCIYRLFAPSFFLASSPVNPSTFMLGFALLYLARNGIKTMTDARQLSESGVREEGRSKDEIDVFIRVTRALEATCSTIIPVIASLASLCHRALSGRKLTSSCVVALSLWIAMVGIEMKALPAAGFYSTSILILAAFTLPALYIRSREGLDIMVEDSMRLLLRLFLSSSKQTIMLSAGAALLVMNRAPLGLVLRVTASASAAIGVLIWRSNPSPANHVSPAA